MEDNIPTFIKLSRTKHTTLSQTTHEELKKSKRIIEQTVSSIDILIIYEVF